MCMEHNKYTVLYFLKMPLKTMSALVTCIYLITTVNNFSVLSGLVSLGLTCTKQGLMCLAQGDNAVRR